MRERLEEKRALAEPAVLLDELTHRPVGHVLTKMGKVADEHLIDALNAQRHTAAAGSATSSSTAGT